MKLDHLGLLSQWLNDFILVSRVFGGLCWYWSFPDSLLTLAVLLSSGGHAVHNSLPLRGHRDSTDWRQFRVGLENQPPEQTGSHKRTTNQSCWPHAAFGLEFPKVTCPSASRPMDRVSWCEGLCLRQGPGQRRDGWTFLWQTLCPSGTRKSSQSWSGLVAARQPYWTGVGARFLCVYGN